MIELVDANTGKTTDVLLKIEGHSSWFISLGAIRLDPLLFVLELGYDFS